MKYVLLHVAWFAVAAISTRLVSCPKAQRPCLQSQIRLVFHTERGLDMTAAGLGFGQRSQPERSAKPSARAVFVARKGYPCPVQHADCLVGSAHMLLVCQVSAHE